MAGHGVLSECQSLARENPLFGPKAGRRGKYAILVRGRGSDL